MPKSSRREGIISWAERTIRLPSAEARSGSLRLAGYQREVLQAFANPKVRQVSVMSPSQCGKTMMLMIMLGYTICNAPRAMMMVSPRESDTKRFIRTKFQPLHDSSPELRQRVARPRNRHAGWSFERIEFQGGSLTFAHSGSPASLRSTTAGVAFADEVDVYRQASVDADNPIEQIQQRLTTFGARGKLVVVSTPIDKGSSLVEAEYLAGSQGEYETPCGHCGVFKALDEEHIPDQATDFLVCPDCGGVIDEAMRIQMITKGRWVHKEPDNPNQSFHLTQLSSPFARLDDTLSQKSKLSPRFWSEAVMARPYEAPTSRSLTIDEAQALIGDCPFDAPTATTVGVDIQGNRLEATITEWNDEGEMVRAHIREHRIFTFSGDTQADFDTAFQAMLARIRNLPKLAYVFVDSGYHPSFVFGSIRLAYRQSAYWRKRLRSARGLAIPNRSTFGMEVVQISRQQIHDIEHMVIAADESKSLAFQLAASGALTVQRDAIPADWAKQFSAERIEERVRRDGRWAKVWVQIRDRNEALDCFSLSLAAYRLREIERMGNRQILIRS